MYSVPFSEIHIVNILKRFQTELIDLIFCSWREKPIQITVQHGGHEKAGAPHEVFVPFLPIFQMCYTF